MFEKNKIQDKNFNKNNFITVKVSKFSRNKINTKNIMSYQGEQS